MRFQTNDELGWSTPRRCLLLGVAGSGMRSLAQILHQAGHMLYGADTVFEATSVAVEKPFVGPANPVEPGCLSPAIPGVQLIPWTSASLPADIDVCICSPAVPASAALHQQSLRQAIPVLSLHAAVGAVFSQRSQVCVAGTHGKSTTSSLLGWMLDDGLNTAGLFVGAEPGGDNRPVSSGRYGQGGPAVIEACEFNHSFLDLTPQHVVLTGIDGDHFDCFESPDAEDAAYEQFLNLLPEHGSVLQNAMCSRSSSVVKRVRVPAVHWAMDDRSAEWSGQIVDTEAGRMTVRIRHRGRHFSDLRVPLFGRHNAENLLAAVAAASCLGTSALQCQTALSGFPGLKRRMEPRGIYQGMRMLDDYAHHPTAVKTTLLAVREQYPGGRIRVVFEPHQVLRLRHYQSQFVESLSLADEVIVLPVFPAREHVSKADCDRISSHLAATICDQGIPAVFTDGVHAAASIVELTGQPKDIFLTMGAGTVHRIHDEVHRRFHRDSAA